MEYESIAEYKSSLGAAHFDINFWEPTPPNWTDSPISHHYYTVAVEINNVFGWYYIDKDDFIQHIKDILSIKNNADKQVVFLERPNQYRGRYILFEKRENDPNQRFLCVRDGIAGIAPLVNEKGLLPNHSVVSGENYIRWESSEIMETVPVTKIIDFAEDLLQWINNNEVVA